MGPAQPKSDKTPASRRSSKGEARRREILQTTLDVLIEDGLIEFSLRRVANRADMRLSSLQHHFPTLDALLSAAIPHALQAQREAARDALPADSSSPEARLRDFARHLLADDTVRTRRTLMSQIQALALQRADVRTALDEHYRLFRGLVFDPLKALFPGLSRPQIEQLAILFTATLNGLDTTLNRAAEDYAALDAEDLIQALLSYGQALEPQIPSNRFV